MTMPAINRVGPYLVVVPILMIILGFYGRMFFGSAILGTAAGAVAGLLWALFTGFAAGWLSRRWQSSVRANTPLLLAIIAIGLMTGAGLMYGWMMAAALTEPSMTGAALSALMWPAVPFYIVLNSAMELLLVALLVFWNWDIDPRRRALIVASVAVYFVMRVWTYLVFAETRLDIASHTLSAADVEWFRQTLATDFRIVLNLVVFALLLIAACIPPWCFRGHDLEGAPRQGQRASAESIMWGRR
jgi:hypothetical protein